MFHALVTFCAATLRMGISERYTTERDKEAPKKVEGTLHNNRGAPGGTVL